MTVLALPFALSMGRILNGVSRPLFGWLSDKFGREQTMFVAFALEGVAFLLFARFGSDPAAFVLLTGLIFLAYGEIYSLFPAICADTYGKRFVSANAGLLYTAKGAASLIVPLSGIIAANALGWNRLFQVLAVMNILAAVLALVALKPMRARVK
jgi:OFA family oxalate/formate antiporter-like MFS transporter